MPTETIEECEAAARVIIAKGAKAVVMTLGSRGCSSRRATSNLGRRARVRCVDRTVA